MKALPLPPETRVFAQRIHVVRQLDGSIPRGAWKELSQTLAYDFPVEDVLEVCVTLRTDPVVVLGKHCTSRRGIAFVKRIRLVVQTIRRQECSPTKLAVVVGSLFTPMVVGLPAQGCRLQITFLPHKSPVVLVGYPPNILRYSPECVEGEFSELRVDGVLQSSGARSCISLRIGAGKST
jgi:hypothetical protein